jgi:chemotaxis protein histidine kinase CheA
MVNPLDTMKHKMKKQIKKIRAQMEDYEIYRENYEYMKCSPLVQSILRENRELKRTIKNLKKMNRTVVKMEPCGPGIVDLTNDNEIEIKTIHLTSEPNIVYDLVECVSDSEDEDADASEDAEEEDADAEDADASAGEDAEEVEEEEAEEEEVDVSAVSEAEEEDAEEEEVEEEVDAEEVDADAVSEADAEEEEEEEEEEADASAVSEAAEEEVEEEADEEVEDAGEEEEEEDAGEEEEEEEDAEEVEEEDAEEEEGVYEVKIKNKTYYVTNETNGTIYAVESDGEVGEEVGKYVDGKAILTVKKTPTKKV